MHIASSENRKISNILPQDQPFRRLVLYFYFFKYAVMEVEALTQPNCAIYPFLKATKGNWRNAIFISCNCTACPYGHKPCCEGYLMTSNSDGTPYILSVERYRAITKDSIDPAECCGSLSRQAFENSYALYLQWHLSSLQDCPLLVHSQAAAGACKF